MKAKYGILIGLILVGCDEKEKRDKIVAQRAREAGERAGQEVNDDIDRALADIKAKEAAAMAKLKSDSAREKRERELEGARRMREIMSERQQAIDNLERARANREIQSVQMTDNQKLAAYEAGGIVGVPAAEANEIIRKAKIQGSPWRINLEIESEGKGYAAVQDFAMRVAQMPTLIRDEIVNSSKREHAGDWSRISDEVTRQAEAWTTLEEWRKTTVPGLTRGEGAAALSAAINRWPGNWEMALRSVNDEVRKLAR
jgi:hypothetical protein